MRPEIDGYVDAGEYDLVCGQKDILRASVVRLHRVVDALLTMMCGADGRKRSHVLALAEAEADHRPAEASTERAHG